MSAASVDRCSVLPASARHEHAWAVRETEIRRSRFIAVAARVDDESQARAMVATLRRRFHDARHVCSAFALGPERRIARSHDDGEPAGTAGAPMLEALTQHQACGGRRDLTDTCVVVVRYFGGIKLGAGGLTRAYSGAVTALLDTLTPVPRLRWRRHRLPAPHAQAGRWESALRAHGHILGVTAYEPTAAVLEVLAPDTEGGRASLAADVAALSGGAAVPEPVDALWRDEP